MGDLVEVDHMSLGQIGLGLVHRVDSCGAAATMLTGRPRTYWLYDSEMTLLIKRFDMFMEQNDYKRI